MNLLDSKIENISIEESLKKSYLDYSMSVIIGRALPDVRDGLKPVHRRILYSMNELNLSPKAPYKKSARIVGNTIGQYHPHGDTAVYDALVRMAQDFSLKNTIVDGQGNFGSIDGDNPAAMRYTEARFTSYAEELLKDLDKKTVDFLPNYDDSLTEPEVLPSRVPNLLINGSSGIAVGMATNIPPHRLDEIIDGTIQLLENPNTDINQLISIIKGPDFPTKGIIFGKKGILDAYKTGRGRIKIRAKLHEEKTKNKDIIVIDELPYQVNKARLIENIASLVRNKAIEGISDIRDESDRKGIRVVIELKKGVIPSIVEKTLYKSTSLETTFGINLLAIKNREPKTFNLLELLQEFISHRKSVVIRRTLYDLQKAESKAHLLQGLQKALKNVDEVVKLIKNSKSSEEAKNRLQEIFNFSLKQSSAILDMKLNRLTSLEKDKLKNELSELEQEINYLNSILGNEDNLKNVIVQELLNIKEKFGDSRQTAIIDDYDEIDEEDLIPNIPVVVTISHRGYIKRTALSLYDKQHRGGKGKTAITTHDDDFIQDFFTSNTHDTLMFITNFGQLYWLKVYRIPEAGRTAMGKAVVNLLQLKENENIREIIPTSDFGNDKSLIFFTKNGVVKRTNLSEFSNIRTNGIRAINLDENDELVTAQIADKNSKFISIFTTFAQALRFEINQIREQGRSTRGVRGVKFKKEGDFVVDGIVINDENDEILTVSENGLGKKTKVSEYNIIKRGGSGVISMKLSARAGKSVIGALVVNPKKDLMALTESGKMIRIGMDTINTTSRNSSGVTIIKGDKVLSISTCPKEKEKI